MDEKAILECRNRYFQLRTVDFAPITASADFSALKCTGSRSNKPENIEQFRREELGKAA